MLNADDLAHKLKDALSATTDANGAPIPPPNMTINYAQGVIAAVKAAIVANAVGTISGVCTPGSSLSGGFGIGGTMIVQPGPMLAKTLPGIHPLAAVNYAKENAAVCAYISSGIVTFSPGSITGQCTNSAESPGPLTNGAGSGGKVTLLTGVACTAAVMAALGNLGALPFALPHYTALINYILANASVTYPSGSVSGICPPGASPLAGLGVGGIIS